MTTFKEAATEFLAQERLAVVGVSRSGEQTANYIYKKLRDHGGKVFPINPNADTVEGDPCYPNLGAVPERLDGVVAVVRPAIVQEVVRECVELGIPRVWMHGNAFFGQNASSVSDEATVYGEENGIRVIAGGCPMMFLDFGHKCMRLILGAMGKLPSTVAN